MFYGIPARTAAYTAGRRAKPMENLSMVTLKKELMLQVNEALYRQNAISKEVYELAKGKIVALHSG